jgi:hypothetical protein
VRWIGACAVLCCVVLVWCLVFGVWCLVFGVWCLGFGVWCLVCGVARCCALLRVALRVAQLQLAGSATSEQSNVEFFSEFASLFGVPEGRLDFVHPSVYLPKVGARVLWAVFAL